MATLLTSEGDEVVRAIPPRPRLGVLAFPFAGRPYVAPHESAVYAGSMSAERAETRKRSVVKALTYRVAIVCLDFLAIYIFTHKVEVALGFMIVSNIYTTVGRFLHERIWARIRWGTEPNAG
jgi:uncharacterized membrane protein